MTAELKSIVNTRLSYIKGINDAIERNPDFSTNEICRDLFRALIQVETDLIASLINLPDEPKVGPLEKFVLKRSTADITGRLKLLRRLRNIKQVDIADALNTERSNYSRLELRGDSLTVEQLKGICKILDVEVHDLLNPEWYPH